MPNAANHPLSASYQLPSASSQLPSASSQLPSASYQLPRLIGAPWRQVSVPAAVIDQVYAEENFGKRVKALLVAVFTTEEIVNNNTIGSEVLGKLDQNKLCAIRGEVSIVIQNTWPPSNPMENPRQAPFTIKMHSIINARCRRIRYGKGEKNSGEKAFENLVSAFLTCTGNSVSPNPNSDPLHQNPNSEPPLNDDREHLDGDHEPLNTSILAVRTSATIRKRLDTQLNHRHGRALSATHLQRQGQSVRSRNNKVPLKQSSLLQDTSIKYKETKKPR
ncbi:Hypp8207 [Branchiostoma lanceolatum]|uniref:Hypp8207 protein n=1 Tax=Branchiostoma lanceolatum TaxID=7740 RepID=A0A8K0EF32_BRALA|nr:Hypp8207 [Branchiostoma lanceolatum]